MNAPLHVAVVGAGIGSHHIKKGYQKLPLQFTTTVLCDLNTDRASSVAAELGVEQICADFSEVCRREDIDVVDICTPPNLHFDQICEALEAGKHVVCEKPLVSGLASVDRLAPLVARSQGRLMPIFQYRYGHALQKLKYLVDQKLTGEAFVCNVDVAWHRKPEYYAVPWRGKRETELGGALTSHAIHALDMALYILGPVKSVFARATTRVNPIEVEDCLALSLEMQDGSLLSMSVTLGSLQEITRHRFTFRNLTAESNTDPYQNSDDPWTFTFASEKIDSLSEPFRQIESLEEGFAGQFQRFYDSLEKKADPPVTLGDARRILELIAAAYHSAAVGEPVELPLPKDHPRYERI